METFEVAGYKINKENLIIMFGACGNAMAYGMSAAGSAPYQVPAGKKLVIMGARFTGNSGFGFGYSDNAPALAGVDPTTLTNRVYQGGGYASLVAHTDGSVPVGFEVPAGKYPFNQNGDGGAANGTYYCVLVDA